MVSVRLLGPVDVVDGDGNVRTIGSALRRTLLALMALRAGEVLTADALLEHAWAGQPPESGLRALRFHISQLRKELGSGGLIETRPGGYRLSIPAEQVDVLALESAARVARRQSDRSVAADMYAEVLAMWRGDPFLDVAPCAALDDDAARLRELRVIITEDCLQARLDAGAGREIIAELSQATSQHPLRESLWAMLITAQYRAGLQADALRSYENMRAMLAETLGLDPSKDLQELQLRILHQDPFLMGDSQLGSPDRSTNLLRRALPSPVNTLIDSDDRLGLAKTVLRDHRLVTLTGPGGVGKTRLAIELGWSSVEQFDAGVALVELAPVTSADSVIGAVASTLSIQPQQGMTHMEAIVDWLSGRELLLIVDNCEHVLEPVRQLMTMVLARCPTVRVVTTSREPLGIAGERVHPVHVLNPEDDGLALFLDRAAAADSTFVAGAGDLETVIDVCRRLDGLPLAIELAAARVRSMAPADLLRRLDDRFRLLRRVPLDGLDHHHALEAATEWSYRLLTEEERAIFNRLSVFTGDFDLCAAEVICTDGNIDRSDIAGILSGLVDKSMVVAERRSEGARYRVLYTLRRFGERQLDAGGTTSTVRTRHLHHYLGVAEEADNLFRTTLQTTGSGIFRSEWNNLRGAHEWALLTGNLRAAERLIAASFQDAAHHSRFEHSEWVDQTITLGTTECPPSPHTLALAAFWAYAVEDRTRGDELLTRGIDLAPSFEDPTTTMCVVLADRVNHPRLPNPFRQLELLASKIDLDREWWVLIELADRAFRDQSASQSLHHARLMETADRVRAPSLLIEAAVALGHRSLTQQPPDFAAAMRLYTEALDISRHSGDLNGDALRAVALAAVGLQPDRAIDSCREALVKLSAARYWYRIWQLMESIGLSLASTGQTEAASVVTGNLEAHHPPFGIEHELGFRARTLGIVGQHPQAEEWMALGAAMDRFQIVDYALAALAAVTKRHGAS